ncbi:MAG: protein kinase [Acidobacteria bacterium]|nr:protein kinase [Acidobacteriota bacterium]
MQCTKCGSISAENLRFCTECGAAMVAAAAAANSAFPRPPTPPYSAPTSAFGGARIGATLDNKYRLDALLGSGGMGEVFRATRLLIGDTVALKVMNAEQLSDPHAVERFRREAQAAARLKHPNAVSIYDFGVSSQGQVFLVMEMVEGQSLRQILKQQGPLTQAAAAEILLQVCAALDEAHKHQIIHRDIKPDNILVNATASGLHVKVLDFGIAKLRDLSVSATNLTQTGSVVGTPHYMSPEQCLGEELDQRSDIYSLGIVLYESLTGITPFNAPNSAAVVVQQVTQAPPPMRSLNPGISSAVEAVILHALEKRRDARPQTAGTLAREMIAAVQGVAIPNTGINTASPMPMTTATTPTLAPTMQMNIPAMASGAHTPINTPFHSGAQLGQWPSSAQVNATTSKKNLLPIILGIAAVVVLALGATIYLNLSSVKSSILTEIKKGNLVKPEGNSAYDLYFKNKNDLQDKDRSEIANQASASLEKRGDDILAQLKQEANESEAEWSEAIRIYTWLNDLRPQKTYEARKYFSQASLTFLKGDFKKALADYQRVIELDANWALALNRLGRTYVKVKNLESAREYYERATKAEPMWINPWMNLGGTYMQLKNPWAAEQSLQRALQLDPQKANAHYMLAQTYEMQENWCAAVNEYEQTISNVGSPSSLGFDETDNARKRLERIRYRCIGD